MELGPSATAALIRGFDWSKTAVGPIESWPASLATIVRTILYSPTPMFLWWGPDLVQFYNDAYVPSFGRGKHPAAMGQSGPQCWPEIWEIIGPQIDRVMQVGIPTLQENALIPIFRNDRLEEVYWTYSYSAVFDDAGAIAGTLVVCNETTPSMVEVRRRLLLQAILERRVPTTSIGVATASAFECLATAANDVPFAAAFAPDGMVIASTTDLSYLRELAMRADALPSLVTLPEPIAAAPWPEPVTEILVVKSRDRATYIFGVSPRLAFDASYRAFFFELISSIDAAIDHALASAAREAAESQRANLYRHFMQAPFPIAVFRGPRHVIDLANEMVLGVWGKDSSAVGKPLSEALPELVGQPFLAWLDEVFATGKRFERNEQRALLERNGVLTEVYTSFSYAPLFDSSGVVEGVMLSANIVTEQVHARQQLEAAHREAERVNEAKDEFLATMSHELRTPLNSMLGWATLLRAVPGDRAKVERGLEVIERNAEAQARLISDLLDVSRIISGKLRLAVQTTDVASAINAAIDVVRPAADAKAITLTSELEGGTLVADPDRLQQIVWNLLINAIKFTPTNGTVTVTAKQTDPWMTIAVTDTGVGIAPEHLGAIFQRFKQIDGSTTRTHGGLGLGLAIVRHLVEGHGGTVAAASPGPDRGATFTVQLPLHAVATSEVVFKSDPQLSTVQPAFARTLEAVRVLIVDDETDSRDLLRVLLEGAGAAVVEAASADQALDRASEGSFDLVISDIGMPGRDGYSFMRELRTKLDVPAIALTAYARTEDARQARHAGFQEHVTKPVDPSKLIETIAALVSP